MLLLFTDWHSPAQASHHWNYKVSKPFFNIRMNYVTVDVCWYVSFAYRNCTYVCTYHTSTQHTHTHTHTHNTHTTLQVRCGRPEGHRASRGLQYCSERTKPSKGIGNHESPPGTAQVFTCACETPFRCIYCKNYLIRFSAR